MSLIFAVLAIADVLLFLSAGVLGFAHHAGSGEGPHILLGLCAALLTILLHCLVFIYLIGTGIGVKEAVEGHELDPALYRRTARFKGRAFPIALFSMIFVVVTAAMGARVDVGMGTSAAHLWWGVATLAFNLLTFPVEIKVIAANGGLMEEVGRLVAKRLGVEAEPSPPAD